MRTKNRFDPWEFQVMEEDFRDNSNDSPVVDIINHMPTDDRQILLVWLYLGSYAAAARHFHCNRKYIARRINEILEHYKITQLCATLRHY